MRENGLAEDRVAVGEADRGLHAEVRLGRVALGLEDREVVGLAGLDAELAHEIVELDGHALGAVHAADVDGELAVDEDPHVVVAGEREDLAALIRELGVQLEREVEVVVAALVAEGLTVEREEVGVVVDPAPVLRLRRGQRVDPE